MEGHWSIRAHLLTLVLATTLPLVALLGWAGGTAPSILLALIVLGCGAGGAQLVSRWMAAPLRALAVATEAVGSGRFGTIVPVGGPAEIVDLVQRFNTMTAQQQQAYSALYASEERYRTLAQNFPNGAVLLFDHELRYTLAAGVGLAATGLSPALLQGKTISEALPPDLCAAIEPSYRTALAGTASVIELRYAGHVYTVHVLPIRDEHGRPVGGMVMSQDVTDRTRAEEQARHAAARMQALAEISQILAEASLDSQAVMRAITERVATTIGDAAAIRLLAADGQSLEPSHLYHPDPELRAYLTAALEAAALRSDEGWHGRVIQTGQPIVIPQFHPEQFREALPPRLWPSAARIAAHSMIIVPLRAHGTAIGTFGLFRDRTAAAYTPDDQAFLQELADRAALAVLNARLFEAAQRELAERRRVEAALRASEQHLRAVLDRAQVLAELSYLVTEVDLDDQTILQTIVRRIAETLGDGCAIQLLDADQQALLPGASFHPDPEAHAAIQAMLADHVQRLDEGLNGQVLRTGEPVVLFEIPPARLKALVKPEYAGYVERFGVHSGIVVPLRVRSRIIGTLTVVRDRSRAAYTADDSSFVQDIADRVAMALNNGQLFSQMQAALQQSNEARALLDVLFATAPVGLAFHDRALRFAMINARLAEINGPSPAAHLGRLPREMIPAFAQRIEPLLGQVLATGQPILDVDIAGESAAVPGQLRHWRANFYPVQLPEGAALGVGVVVVDMTDQKRAEESLRQYAHRLRHLRIIDQAILALQPPITMARATARHIRQMLLCSRVSIVAIDQEREEISVLAVDSEGPDALGAGKVISMAAYPPPPILASGQVHLVDDFQAVDEISPGEQMLKASGVRSYLIVPLMAQDTLIGAIGIGADEPGAFRTEHIELVREVAAQLTIALQNARLFEEVRLGRERLQLLSTRLVDVQEAERRHVARELHDEIGQALTGVKLYLHTLQRAHTPAEMQASIEETLHTVDHALKQVRSLSLSLRPSMLDDFGLVSALRWLVQRQVQLAGLSAEVIAEPEQLRLPTEIATTCFRIAQEALTNTVRHAAARHVTVQVREVGAELQLDIRDDGIGFDVRAAQERAAQGGSLGVLGMQERAQLVGGRLQLRSQPGQGTEISVRLPRGPHLSER